MTLIKRSNVATGLDDKAGGIEERAQGLFVVVRCLAIRVAPRNDPPTLETREKKASNGSARRDE